MNHSTEYGACSKRSLSDLSDHLNTEAEGAENTFYQPQNILSGDRQGTEGNLFVSVTGDSHWPVRGRCERSHRSLF